MANTFVKIASTTVGSGGAANIDFTSIPSTYTDLCLKTSIRSTSGSPDIYLRFNSSTTNFSDRVLYGLSASTVGSNATSNIRIPLNSASSTSNIFSNSEVYIPNYSSAVAHSVSVDGVAEDNGTTYNIMWLGAGLWNSATIISSINILPASGNFAQYSTATLYGIKSS